MAQACDGKRKRVPDDEVADHSPDSKLARSDSAEFRSDLDRTSSGGSELGRVDTDADDSASLEESSPSATVIHRDLIDILDESDNVGEREPAIQDLDSVIKSFEEEILAPGSDLAADDDPNVPSESSDLRHLLEASDDELGLPPTVTPTVEEEGKLETEGFRRFGPDGIDLSNFIGFDDDIPQYESLGYGSGVFVEYGGGDDNAGGFVTLDGLFDYSEPSDILWRSESLQAM